MSGIKVTRESPATPLPTILEVSGDVDGDDVDWPTGPNSPFPLDGLSNVDTTGKADGDTIVWDAGTGKWIPAPGGGSDDDCTPIPHGSMGSTEPFDRADGEVHTGTLTADLTVTLTAPDCDAALLELWLTQDGTGGWDITWPGSVTVNGTPDTTLGTTTVWLLDTVDGGTSWVAFIAGGGTVVASLDDLTDVTITAPAEHDRLAYNGSTWVNDAGYWEPVTNGDVGTPEVVFEDGDIVMEWVPG